MKKIVRGNDFTLRIPVRKIVGGQTEKFPLPACEEVEVNLVNAFRRRKLEFAVSVEDDSLIEARVESGKLALGAYALEVHGKLFGCSWRSNEYEQIMLVDNNAKGDTEFGEVIEGEDSVEMDTAIVVLPPTAELGKLIDNTNDVIQKANSVIANVGERADKAVAETQKAVGDAQVATANAQIQADRAKAQADHPNKVGDDGYWWQWDEATGEYVRTDIYSRGTIDYPTFVVSDDAELYVNITDGNDKRFELSEDGELLINMNNNI